MELSLIPDGSDVSEKRFVILNMLYPSLKTVGSSKTKAYGKLYRKLYGSTPETMSNYGFDITFDTLLRLYQLEDFEKTVQKTTGHTVLRFEYQKNEYGYYSNQGINIYQYENK